MFIRLEFAVLTDVATVNENYFPFPRFFFARMHSPSGFTRNLAHKAHINYRQADRLFS